jgi:hypothetical protein
MSVLEPVVQRSEAGSVVPQQRDGTEPVGAPAPRAVVDHIAAHSMKCYWDFTECRWQCSRD